jgi:hypothetical protein
MPCDICHGASWASNLVLGGHAHHFQRPNKAFFSILLEAFDYLVLEEMAMNKNRCLLMMVSVVFAVSVAWAEVPDYGDDYTTAEPIDVLGTETVGELSDTSDEDWFSFSGVPYGLYKVTVVAQSGSKTIHVYGPGDDSQQIVTFSASAGTSQSETVYLTAAGTYFLRVRVGQVGIYRISVEELAVYPASDPESDTCLSPELLVANDPPTASTIWSNGLDEDWYTFETEPLHLYRITLTRADNHGNVRYDLRYTDCGGSIVDTTSVRTIVSWFGENYDLRIYTSYQTEAWYQIQVEDIAEFVDDHANVYPDAATLDTIGTRVEGSIQYAANINYNQDLDWFKFEAVENGLYQISLRSLSGSKRADLYATVPGGLAGSATVTISANNDEQWKDVFLPEPGTYYLKVSSSAEGVYDIGVEELGVIAPDTYADSCAGDPAPTELVVDDPPVVGTLSTSLDQDWFTLQTQYLHHYRINLYEADNASRYVRFALFPDTCVDPLRTNRTELDFVAWDDTRYYIQVTESGGNLAYYELEVVDLATYEDDHGNTCEQATAILPNGQEVAGFLNYDADILDDEDWFAFTALHDSTYQITINSPGYKTLNVYKAPDCGTTSLLALGANQTKPLDVTEGSVYYLRVKLGATGSYTVAVSGPEPVCGDVAHPYPAYDFNHDCLVNLKDFAMFALEWLACTDPNPPCEYKP